MDGSGVQKPAPVAARPANVPMPGTLLTGRYRLESIVGRGATAFVFSARDEWLKHKVAIKVGLHEGLLASNIARALRLGLREEALAGMRLSHPNVLRIFNYERDGRWEFLVMELFDGDELSSVCRRRPGNRLSSEETARIGIDCLEALAHAHALGIVHNDLKPSNILMTRRGGVKLCDFGLARGGSNLDPGTRELVAGTPAFMSPELVHGERDEPRSDLYALAATLYALGNGEPMFGHGQQALARHCHEPPPRSPFLDPRIDEILRVATAKSPAQRYANAEAMAEALRAALEELSREVPILSGDEVLFEQTQTSTAWDLDLDAR